VRFVSRALAFTTRASPPHARLAYGLVALLAAKVASFSVAAQVYSDLFVLLIMGWSLGFLLAMPGLAARAQAQRQAAANLAPGPQKAIAPHRGPPAWAR
jgi:protein-S-isoprenylcysteine O-methyltransferase Ste14